MGLVRTTITTVLLIAILGVLLILLGSGIRDVSVEDFRITGLEDINTQSFTFTGELDVKNPARVTVPIDNITYDIIINETGEVISKGKIPSFSLQGQAITTADISQQVNWKPTMSTAIQLMSGNVVMVIKGNATVDVYGITTYTLPFSDSYSLNEYLEQRTQQDTPKPMEVNDTTEDVQNGVENVTEKIVNDSDDSEQNATGNETDGEDEGLPDLI